MVRSSFIIRAQLLNLTTSLLNVMLKFQTYPLKCLSIGTPKTINFPFVANGKLMVFRRTNIQVHYNEAVSYLNFGTPKNY